MKKILPRGVAAIDLGTNTFRLVTRGFQTIEYPRIGRGVDRTGRLSPAAVRAGLNALSKFHRIVRRRRLRVIGVVGTSALRDAANGPAFCKSVQKKFGWTIEVIPGEFEAELTFIGATSTLDLPRGGLVLVSDVGGGSTELIWGTRSSVAGGVSLQLGSVRMTERFGTQGKTSDARLTRLRAAIRVILKNSGVPWKRITTVIGVGGTATTLSAILHGVDPYDETKVHSSTVPRAAMEKMRDVFALMTPRERQLLPSVPRGRADIITAGTAIQTEIVAHTRADRMIASDSGILTGLILRNS